MNTQEEILPETANDRLKQSFPTWFWGSVFAAAIMHAAVLALGPVLLADDASFTMETMMAIEMPPEVEIPPPPEEIRRPANPVVSAAQINQDVTISLTDFESNLPTNLPPPPVASAQVDISTNPTFIVVEQYPEIRNTEEVRAALGKEYPATLRDQRIGGRVTMHVYVSATGQMEKCQLAPDGSSGYTLLDDAALRVCSVYRFVPARNMGENVAVWVQIPLEFSAR
jgi:protein TonB